jgi:hypothetical protein
MSRMLFALWTELQQSFLMSLVSKGHNFFCGDSILLLLLLLIDKFLEPFCTCSNIYRDLMT